jgi:hypothetical protein
MFKSVRALLSPLSLWRQARFRGEGQTRVTPRDDTLPSMIQWLVPIEIQQSQARQSLKVQDLGSFCQIQLKVHYTAICDYHKRRAHLTETGSFDGLIGIRCVRRIGKICRIED